MFRDKFWYLSLQNLQSKAKTRTRFKVFLNIFISIYMIARRLFITLTFFNESPSNFQISHMVPTVLLSIVGPTIATTDAYQQKKIKPKWMYGLLKLIPIIWILFEYVWISTWIRDQDRMESVDEMLLFISLQIGLESLWLAKYIAILSVPSWLKALITTSIPLFWTLYIVFVHVQNKGFLLFQGFFITFLVFQQSTIEILGPVNLGNLPPENQAKIREDNILKTIGVYSPLSIVLVTSKHDLQFSTQKFQDTFIKPYETSFQNFCTQVKNLHRSTGFRIRKGNAPSLKIDSLAKSLVLRSRMRANLDPTLSLTKKMEGDAANLLELLDTLSDYCKKMPDAVPNEQFNYSCKLYPKQDESYFVELEISITFIPTNHSFLISFEEIKNSFVSSSLFLNNEKFTENLILTISHELHTPLGLNISLLTKALKQVDFPSNLKESFIKPALVSAKLLHYVACDIVDFLSLSAEPLNLKVHPVNLEHIINHCISLIKGRAKLKGLQVLSNLDLKEQRIIKTDKSKLTRILVNLLNNALKFTNQGIIQISAVSFNKKVKITVEDEGIGITAATQKKIEDILTKKEMRDRPSTNSAGIGLGLFMANELAILLNPSSIEARITFESEEGAGSKFSFTIEDLSDNKIGTILLDEEADSILSAERLLSDEKLSYNISVAETPETSARLPIVRKVKTLGWRNSLDFCESEKMSYSPKLELFKVDETENLNKKEKRLSFISKCPEVLIVDDEPFNILALEIWLNELKCSYHSITQSSTVINHLLEAAKDVKSSNYFYKMIVLDLNMPEISGLELAHKLIKLMEEKKIPHVVLIAHSAYPKDQYEQVCKQAGMQYYLQKPVQKFELANMVKKIVKKV